MFNDLLIRIAFDLMLVVLVLGGAVFVTLQSPLPNGTEDDLSR